MCPPPLLAGAALVASIAGTGLSAYGQYQSAKSQKYALQQQADTARMNAAIAGVNATNIEAIGALNSRNILEIGELNAGLTERIGDLNAGMTEQMASLGDKIADGNYQLMLSGVDTNLKIAEFNAQSVLEAGQDNEQRVMLESAALKSTQRAQLAASGVALDSDSSLRILTTTDYLGEVDANTLHTNAVREALGIRLQARAEADAAKAGALAYKAQALGASLSARAEAFNTRVSSTVGALNVRTAATFEALNTRINTDSAALDARIRGAGFNADASAASIARTGIMPGVQAGATLLQGAGQVAGSWYSYKKAGVFG